MREVAETRQAVADGLRKIGIEYGDVVLVRSALKSIGIQAEYSGVAVLTMNEVYNLMARVGKLKGAVL